MSSVIAIVLGAAAFSPPPTRLPSPTRLLTSPTRLACRRDFRRRDFLTGAAAWSAASFAAPAFADEAAQAAQLDVEFDHNVEGLKEEHLPKITIGSGGATSSKVTMLVPHVMNPGAEPHFIELLWIKEKGSYGEKSKVAAAKAYSRQNLGNLPAGQKALLEARLPAGKTWVPMVKCNLHGVWEGEPFST